MLSMLSLVMTVLSLGLYMSLVLPILSLVMSALSPGLYISLVFDFYFLTPRLAYE